MATSLDATVPAGVVDEDAPHQLGGDADGSSNWTSELTGHIMWP